MVDKRISFILCNWQQLYVISLFEHIVRYMNANSHCLWQCERRQIERSVSTIIYLQKRIVNVYI